MLTGISLIVFQALNPVMASIIMPGLGQMIQGERAKAHTFFAVEGAVWLSYLGFNYWGDRLDVSARAFAIEHAGANPLRDDAEYFDAVEDYLSSVDYNLTVERYASLYFPDDPRLQQEYIEANAYFDVDEWEWEDVTSRTSYWEQRKQSREHKRRASFMPGFAIINRIVSVVDVLIFSNTERFGLDTSNGKIGLYYKF